MMTYCEIILLMVTFQGNTASAEDVFHIKHNSGHQCIVVTSFEQVPISDNAVISVGQGHFSDLDFKEYKPPISVIRQISHRGIHTDIESYSDVYFLNSPFTF